MEKFVQLASGAVFQLKDLVVIVRQELNLFGFIVRGFPHVLDGTLDDRDQIVDMLATEGRLFKVVPTPDEPVKTKLAIAD